MTPVDQTKFGGPTAPDGERGDCFAACVATILSWPLIDVPNFCGLYSAEEWYGKFVQYLAEHGMGALTQNFTGDPESFFKWVDMCAPNIPYIAGGPASRGHLHCCVYVGRHLWHDPHPSREGLLELQDATYILTDFADDETSRRVF